MHKFIILALCIASTSASQPSQGVAPFLTSGASIIAPQGVVNPVIRCGGVGTFLQLRVTGCDGGCTLTPGVPVDIECDFIPSSASPSLSLKLLAKVFGVDVIILEVVLPNSSVQPAQQYTVIFSITPNDMLSGQTVTLSSNIFHTDSELLELCFQNQVTIV